MRPSTNDDFANRELSIDELETVAAGVGLHGPGPIIPPLPPHFVWPHPHPSPIWFGVPVLSFKLF